MFYTPSTSNLVQFPGDWSELPQWWQETYTLWLKQNWLPISNSMSIKALSKIPVCNNRLLSFRDKKHTNVCKSANGTAIKLRYSVYRTLGFLCFNDFLHSDYTVKLGNELRAGFQDLPSQRPMTIDTITSIFCTALSKHIAKMWSQSKREWLAQLTQSEEQARLQLWKWYKPSMTESLRITNKMIKRAVE